MTETTVEYELFCKNVKDKDLWGIVIPTPGVDHACVWPYFIKLICRMGHYVNEAREQDQIFWQNTHQKAQVMFERESARDELAAMLNVCDLWHLAQQECAAFYVTRPACAQVHLSLVN